MGCPPSSSINNSNFCCTYYKKNAHALQLSTIKTTVKCSLVIKTGTGKTKTKTITFSFKTKTNNKTANGDVKQNIAYSSGKHFLHVIILSA